MSVERRINQLREASDARFTWLTRTYIPSDGITAQIREKFIETTVDITEVKTIDDFRPLAEEIGITIIGEKEVYYPDFLVETYNLNLRAQEHTIESNKRTKEQIIDDFKPGVAKKLALARIQGTPKREELASGCSEFIYQFTHGKIVMKETNTGQYL